ncbi:MAG: SDR family NAD(P)-dependent oxidoreductase [Chloroflexi bacterium]|nr:SDR family NAD(P)-dependent oxidoreductase [Chloroflexota bacterium]
MTQKTAVITGAGGGMGRAIALKFAEAGIRPILVGRTEAKLRSVAAEVAARGITAGVHILDVTDDEAIAAFGAYLADTALDVLVNCAGDWLIAYLQDTSNDQLDQILRTNLRAPYILSRALLPNLRRSDNASIINIGSLVTSISVPTVSAYTAAKVGLKGLTGSLAAELRPELIRVVMISPGPADTPMRDAASPGIDKSLLVRPDTIAEMVHAVVTLPRGITTSDFVLYSMRWE